MRKYLTIEVLIDDKYEDAEQCAREVIFEASGHHFCCDGTVKLNIIENNTDN